MEAHQAQEEHAERAIARVLEAERQAREAIARCAEERARLVSEAQAGALAIAARGERRIGALRARMAQATEQQIAALQRRPVDEESIGPAERVTERLQRAVAAVADELAGGAE